MDLIKELVNENLIVLNLKATSNLDAIEQLATVLYDNKYVKESYINAIKEREKVFCTGLPTEEVGVAIPHTDVEHVIKPAIAVALLAKPVKFEMMGMPENKVDVEIMFMLAIKEPHAQIELLETLMGILENKRLLNMIKYAKSSKDISNILLNR